ncbi:MAG TPA: YicC/YloC family endoribonuclease [Vicinamibacteria bacterium]|nr:YicC/YloC family endoribonuclease [Vicinamibacteria bacterium]
MIRSMTGYGQAALDNDALRVAVSVRSLNHRYLEVALNLSRRVQALEPEIKALVQSRLARGKVDVTLRATFPDGEATVVPRQRVIAGAVSALRALRDEYSLAGQVGVAEVARFPGAFEVVEEQDALEEDVRRSILELVANALDSLQTMRMAEGARLGAELRRLVDGIERAAAEIERLQDEGKAARREVLVQKARELAGELGLEDARLYAEVVRAAERLDVTEELQRLRSHVSLARELVASPEPQGKRLDFVAQEMVREANTIGSKASQAPVSHAVIAAKAEIEKFREQVQNVE